MEATQTRADVDELMDVCDTGNPEELRQLGPIQPINYASIAKLCDTDTETIELIVREIVCQLK